MRHRLCALAVVVLLCASACSDPEPQFADPTSEPPTSEPVSTPTSDPPTSTSTPEPVALSPEETVRAWVKARNRLLRTGNAAAISALSAEGCSTCRDLNTPIVDLYSDGGFVRTRGWVVKGAKAKPDFAETGRVATAIVFSAGQRRESAEAATVRYPEERNFLDFVVERTGERWLVTQVVFLS